jgi:hypothetical protein
MSAAKWARPVLRPLLYSASRGPHLQTWSPLSLLTCSDHDIITTVVEGGTGNTADGSFHILDPMCAAASLMTHSGRLAFPLCAAGPALDRALLAVLVLGSYLSSPSVLQITGGLYITPSSIQATPLPHSCLCQSIFPSAFVDLVLFFPTSLPSPPHHLIAVQDTNTLIVLIDSSL